MVFKKEGYSPWRGNRLDWTPRFQFAFSFQGVCLMGQFGKRFEIDRRLMNGDPPLACRCWRIPRSGTGLTALILPLTLFSFWMKIFLISWLGCHCPPFGHFKGFRKKVLLLQEAPLADFLFRGTRAHGLAEDDLISVA